MKQTLLILYLTIFITGCSLAPKYIQPEMDLPDSWGSLTDSTNPYDGRFWWKRFNDPVLNTLVEEALEKNQNLLIATARLEQARASWGISKSNMFPTLSTNVSGSYGRQESPIIPGRQETAQQYSLSVGLQYEIDFWGKFYNLSKIGKAQYLTVEANREIVRLTLIANLITAYFDVITLEKQEKFLQDSLDAITKQLTIRKQEFALGAITAVEVKQMEAQVASIDTQKANIGSLLIDARSALLILLGRSPREMITKQLTFKDSVWDFSAKYQIPPGLPAYVLLRRPDIYQAEQSIRSANANIGVARAAYFPSISLNAVVGALSGDISRLFSNPVMWNAGGQSSAPLFGAGRIIFQNRVAKAQQKEALAMYQLAVQNAYKDVITSLSQLKQTQVALSAATISEEAFKETYILTQKQYDIGQVSSFQLLTILQNYITAQEQLLIAQKNRLTAVVNMFRSLGGDWEDPEAKKERENKEKKLAKEEKKKNNTTKAVG